MKNLCFLFYIFIEVVISSTLAKVCETNACRKLAEELQTMMNKDVDPCDDFSSYICGNFDKVYSIPSGENKISPLDQITDEIKGELKVLLEKQNLKTQNVPQTKAAIFYKSCLNIRQRNIAGKYTLTKFVNKITKHRNYIKNLISLITSGIISRMISINSIANPKDVKYNILQIDKPNLILPEENLRSPESDIFKKQIIYYKRYMTNVLKILGLWNKYKTFIDGIVRLHVKLAKGIPSTEERADIAKSVNILKIKDLQKKCNQIPWKLLINEVLKQSKKKLKDNDTISVFSLNYIDVLCSVIREYMTNSAKLELLEFDLKWAAIHSLAPYGSEKLVQAHMKIYKDIGGIKGKKPLWKTCVDITSSTFVEIIGNMYVKNKFPASRKKDIEFMIRNVRNAFRDNINKTTWMDLKTKAAALTKIDYMKFKIGYPDSLLSESKLMKDNENVSVDIKRFMQNYIDDTAIKFIKLMITINEKISNDEFLPTYEAEAGYNPLSNEFIIPAAILRYPFYDIDLPTSYNYGAIGNVIGHEISHGFDNTGSKFDENGYLRNWWSTESKKEYKRKTKCISDQYGKYKIYNQSLSSNQSLGEDIADNAGFRVAYKAVNSNDENREKLTLPGLNFTVDQLVFVAQARIWCSITTEKATLQSLKTDVHSFWKYRINGPLSNMPEFSKHFKCNRNKPMNRAKKCLVW